MIRRILFLSLFSTALLISMPSCSSEKAEAEAKTETAAECSDCEGDACTCKAGECKCEGCG